MTKFECHKLQEGYFNVQGYFEYPRKILCRFQLREIRSHESVQTTQSKRLDAHQSVTYVRTRWQYRPDAHQCLETLNYSRLHLSKRNSKSVGNYLEFEKILTFLCIRLDDVIFCPTLNYPSIIHPDDENFPSEPSFMSRSFELFQVAFVWMSQ
jgi:hypothetical protein